ncbi:MAG: transcriptional regulator [Ruminococcus sp.]|nr:transcriptional regulator [Ruminococcus sp.]
MIYSEKLREIREENNLKLQDISKILGIDASVYGKYEREYILIPIKYLNDICNYFNISIDYIFDFTNSLNYINSTKDIDKKLSGTRLKDFRKENNLTQAKLAELLNTVHPVITNYENGKNLIATPFLYTICNKYHISADYLLGKIDSPKYLK